MTNNQDKTNKAILDQLVYIDNFIGEDNDLNFDLSAFADDSFIFADEEKPHNDKIDEILQNKHLNDLGDKLGLHLNNLPRFPVPPGAKSSLEQAGLNQSQIDLLSALIAQYQLVQHTPDETLNIDPQLGSLSGYDFQNQTQIESLHSQHQSQTQSHVHKEGGPSYTLDSGLSTQSMFLDNLDHLAPVDISEITPQYQHTPAFPDTISPSGSTRSAVLDAPLSIDNDLDKRRRNTAASARFRIRKKLKEKQLEDQISGLQDTIRNFESKIQTLELENKLLKELVIEKGTERSDQELKKFRDTILKKEK